METQQPIDVAGTALGPRVLVEWRMAFRLQDWARKQGIGTTLYSQPRTRKASLLLRTNLSVDRVRELLQRAPR